MVCDTCKMNLRCIELERMGKVPRHEKCRCFIPVKPITNADHIRAMTDEALAEEISFLVVEALDQVFPESVIGKWKATKAERISGTARDLLDWLKQEADDE